MPTPETELLNIYNYRPIDEKLCTSGQPTESQLRSIAESGFTIVINLALHNDPRYSLNDELGTVRSLGMTYIHIPVQFDMPLESDLLAFFYAMDTYSSEKLWIHCAANKRVSAFLGLYRIIRQGWERERAFELMNSIWQPDEVWSSFISIMLERFL